MAAILSKKRAEKSRYYGDFRGVDFSSDHTQVNERRLAYAVNMYRDYQSGQGQAIETIAGFRKRVVLPEKAIVHGLFFFSHKESGNIVNKVLIHAGTKLYLWNNYPKTINVPFTITVAGARLVDLSENRFEIELTVDAARITSLRRQSGEDLTERIVEYNPATKRLSFVCGDLTGYNERTEKYDERLLLTYIEGEISADDVLFDAMNDKKSTSFIMNNRLWIIDGKNYIYYDGTQIKSAASNAYIPTTYINIIPSGENKDNGKEMEQRNILQPLFKHTFYGDGTTKEFKLNDTNLERYNLEKDVEVRLYEGKITIPVESVDLDNGIVVFSTPPPKPTDVVMIAAAGGENIMYPRDYAGVEITARKNTSGAKGSNDKKSIFESLSDAERARFTMSETLITHCTVAALYDNRVFLSGNPDCPNFIFYSALNDPAYFGILNYEQDGVGIAPITGMMSVADTLLVLKNDSQQDATAYFHTPSLTDINVYPKTYPASQGLSGIGCLGACANFLDDPIFISRLGVEAVGQLSVRLERANEHRSSLIDAKLVNLDLSDAQVEEWNGYLLVLVDGKMFMADSRQKYESSVGVPQYEWYYIEGVGVYERQYPEYSYASFMEKELKEANDGAGSFIHYRRRYCRTCGEDRLKCTCGDRQDIAEAEPIELPLKLADSVYFFETNEVKDLRGTPANAPDINGETKTEIYDEAITVTVHDDIVGDMEYDIGVYYTVGEVRDPETDEITGHVAYLLDGKGNYTGGEFKKATVIKNIEDNIFFGTQNGVVCSFNFDMRGEDGEIPISYYTFDERTIFCGAATKMDNCGIPHLTKSTVKKSTVIKTKSFRSSAAKVKVRTNKKPYTQIARINNSLFSFEDLNFADFTFNTYENSLHAVKEKEKQWVEKQYYVYSDEYLKPFALYYISFRYVASGRFKNN